METTNIKQIVRTVVKKKDNKEAGGDRTQR